MSDSASSGGGRSSSAESGAGKSPGWPSTGAGKSSPSLAGVSKKFCGAEDIVIGGGGEKVGNASPSDISASAGKSIGSANEAGGRMVTRVGSSNEETSGLMTVFSSGRSSMPSSSIDSGSSSMTSGSRFGSSGGKVKGSGSSVRAGAEVGSERDSGASSGTRGTGACTTGACTTGACGSAVIRVGSSNESVSSSVDSRLLLGAGGSGIGAAEALGKGAAVCVTGAGGSGTGAATTGAATTGAATTAGVGTWAAGPTAPGRGIALLVGFGAGALNDALADAPPPDPGNGIAWLLGGAAGGKGIGSGAATGNAALGSEKVGAGIGCVSPTSGGASKASGAEGGVKMGAGIELASAGTGSGNGTGSGAGSALGGGPIMVRSLSSASGRTMKRCLHFWQVMAPPVFGIFVSSTR